MSEPAADSEAVRIADWLREQAMRGLESELVASALIDYSELIREGAYRTSQ